MEVLHTVYTSLEIPPETAYGKPFKDAAGTSTESAVNPSIESSRQGSLDFGETVFDAKKLTGLFCKEYTVFRELAVRLHLKQPFMVYSRYNLFGIPVESQIVFKEKQHNYDLELELVLNDLVARRIHAYALTTTEGLDTKTLTAIRGYRIKTYRDGRKIIELFSEPPSLVG